MKIIIIGRGNVSCNLLHAFRQKNIDVTMVSSREGLDRIPQNADVYLYAVRDAALIETIGKVRVQSRALHLHTSGTMPLTVFGEDKPHCGIFYPFQTFSKEHILPDFSAVPVFFEAKGIDDISAIYSLALTITPHVYEANQKDRERLHVAGVLVNNFPNLLYGLAADLLRGTHIPFESLLPLIDETAAKVHSLPPNEAQTGPARRHDHSVMDKHISLLPTEDAKEVYRLLSRMIEDKYPEA